MELLSCLLPQGVSFHLETAHLDEVADQLTWRVTSRQALGGKAGVRLSQRGGLGVSRNTLLRVLRRLPLPGFPTPTGLGVDDWALRKRHTYGTILVDLEQRRPIARLKDRDADTLAQWLRAHPGVQITTGDRSKAYEDGARQGAPAAIQVADRFHLLQNLAEVLDQVFNAHIQELNALNMTPDTRRRYFSPDGTPAAPVPPPRNATDAVVQAQQRRARRLATYEQVWALHRQGYTGDAIARQLRIGKSTVFRDLRTATFPERQGRSDRGRSVLDPYKPYLLSRWNAGCPQSTEWTRAIPTRRCWSRASARMGSRSLARWPTTQAGKPGRAPDLTKRSFWSTGTSRWSPARWGSRASPGSRTPSPKMA